MASILSSIEAAKHNGIEQPVYAIEKRQYQGELLQSLTERGIGVACFDDVPLIISEANTINEKTVINGYLFVKQGYISQTLGTSEDKELPMLALMCGINGTAQPEHEIYAWNFSVKSGIMQSTGAELYFNGPMIITEHGINDDPGVFLPITADFHSRLPLTNFEPGFTLNFGRFFYENQNLQVTGKTLHSIAPHIIGSNYLNPFSRDSNDFTLWYGPATIRSMEFKKLSIARGIAVPITKYFDLDAQNLDLAHISAIKSSQRPLLDAALGVRETTEELVRTANTRGKYFLLETPPLSFPSGYTGIIEPWAALPRIGGFTMKDIDADWWFDTAHLASTILGPNFPLNADQGGAAPIRGEYRVDDRIPDNLIKNMPIPKYMVIKIYHDKTIIR